MAPFPHWFELFCRPDTDRLQVLVHVLHRAGVPFELVRTDGFRHVQVRGARPSVPQPGEKVVLAHYDRVAGVPGANDNGASVLALVDYLRGARRGVPLRVVFTDGEELTPGQGASDQGAYALARSWGRVEGVFPVVFDMTGIGDTLVLGHLAEALVRKVRPSGPPTGLGPSARVRIGARRWLAACGAGDTVEVNTPFSDDLGLLLAGIPAAQVSLLPRKEALAYKKDGTLPPAWRTMHTPGDAVSTLWPGSRTLMAEVLDRLEDFPL